MHVMTVLRSGLVALALAAIGGGVRAGDAPKKEEPPKKEEAPAKAEAPKKAAKGEEGLPEDVVAKVDGVMITRADLALARRQIVAMNPKAAVPNNEALLDQLADRVLWMRYFEKEGLRAAGAELQRAIQQIDAELRQRGASYPRWIASLGLTAEEHAGMIGFDLATGRLRERLVKDIQEEEIKKEFEAHPEWYDGSRVRISQIFVETADVAHDADKLKKAKERGDKIYAELQSGKDFDRLARDYSEGMASIRGGDRGWFTRKGTDEDEPLMAAAWNLKVGEFTRPIQGARGLHVLKLLDREPARLTAFGARPAVVQELVRRRVKAILDELKAKASIEKRL